MNRMPIARLAIAGALGAVLLTGCSQIDALAPVGGEAQTTIRNATYDVLLDNGVEILVAPTCAKESTQIICRGSTVTGAPIVATGASTKPYTLRIEVDGVVIFDGSATDVLADALLEGS